MQEQRTSQGESLTLSRSGVLFVAGYGTALRVERGHLRVRSGQGSDLSEAHFSRVCKPAIRRVVIYGRGGYTTWEALQWLDGVGASFLNLSLSGRIIVSSGDLGPDQAALRRAQVRAADGEIGLQIVRALLSAKLQGQRDVLAAHIPDAVTAADAVGEACEHVVGAPSVPAALKIEAQAAGAYWKAWSHLPVTFARADRSAIPKHWCTAGERRSQLTRSPRLATTPVGAMLNYLYALAEFECRLALLAVGLDPGLGWAHKDAKYRDSAALDLLESIRPSVDAYLAQLLVDRRFSRREFIELPSGQVRLARSLAKELTPATLPAWERDSAPGAEHVARLIAAGAEHIRVPGQRSRGSRGKGRSTLGRRIAPTLARARPIVSACRECGVVLADRDRAYCEECLPKFKAQRTTKFVSAARSVLAEMRASEADPARSPEAKAKRVATNARRRQEAIMWEREHPGRRDPRVFRSEILRGLRRVTLPQMMKATGLSSGYCWRIRRGERVPHPMYWEALRLLSADSTGRDSVTDATA